LSSARVDFKRAGLHYIAFSDIAIATTSLVQLSISQIAKFGGSVTNFS
jgi:hypothetical protein